MADADSVRRSKISVLIADDHPIFRTGMRDVIEKDDRYVVVGESENGEDALQKMMDLKPRVAILDIQMPKMTGLAVAQRAEKLSLETNIILLTMLEDKRVFLEAMETGVTGYVLKDSASTEILRAIGVVSEGKHYISPTLSGLLVERKNKAGGQFASLLSKLTPSEIRILRLIADLKSNQEISAEMFISHRTVENHRVNISRKLGLSGTHSLLKFALQNKADLG
ncbi:MAG TPA: response regulator transcription factor [Bacteroidota bacterium]|nr:response regulator transcription factor [Bacteroidota bacterium]